MRTEIEIVNGRIEQLNKDLGPKGHIDNQKAIDAAINELEQLKARRRELQGA